MAQVAILGTEGTGKTVLMAVMAKVFQEPRKGVQLIPSNMRTSQHVTKVLKFLFGGDWPPSNPAGFFLELGWDLFIQGETACHIQFLEIAGQDFRSLFTKDEIDISKVTPAQKQLLNYMGQSEIIVFLLNLGDFVGESDLIRRDENQWALKNALDWTKRANDSKTAALVITQSDQYQEVREKFGSWEKVVQKYLPFVAGAHLNGSVPLFAVSAVGETRVVIDKSGNPRRVPPKKWTCNGVVPLVHWMGKRTMYGEDFDLEGEKLPNPVNPMVYVFAIVCVLVITFVSIAIIGR